MQNCKETLLINLSFQSEILIWILLFMIYQ
jgi:hypothetical protein